MATAAQLRAQEKYDKNHTKTILLKLNLTNDADILSKLDDTDNKQGYIKRLLRQDIRGNGAVLSVDSLRYIIKPIAKRHHIERVYLFGSYARGQANEHSDIDLVIEGGNIESVSKYEELKEELGNAFGKNVDLVMYEAIIGNSSRSGKRFMAHFEKERIKIYG